MANISSLTPFKKGQSGNPNGRPPGSISITKAIKEELAKIPEGSKKTHLELLVKRVMERSIKQGDIQMLKTVWNYIDGMPVQKMSGDFSVEQHSIYDGKSTKTVQGHQSNKKDIQPNEEDKSN